MTKDKKQPNPWYFGFEEYERVKEPNKKQKSFAWTTAIGLQAVDGLTTSDYLIETARRNIEGEISIQEANKLIDAYYESEAGRIEEKNERTEEADKVSARIAEILNDGTFSLRPSILENIHGRLFKDIYKFAGKKRDYNITKKEWVLDGDTVYYTDFNDIETALKYDFDKETDFSYKGLSDSDFIIHFSKFISNIWQIHPFGEGNTRTTAVFAIKYLNNLGWHVNNEPFVQDSWYFRNALVRANYNSSENHIKSDFTFLNMFFRNLLLGEKNILKNRFCHIYWQQSNNDVGVNVGVNVGVTNSEEKILKCIQEEPNTNSTKIAEKINLSKRQVERLLASLKSKGIIDHIGADRNGQWKILK